MKKPLLLTMVILVLLPCSLAAQGHRIGVGLGSTSGVHEQGGEETTLKGELLELPLYTYAARNGLLIGFRLMEFSLSGESTSGLQRTEINYKQTLLAASVGLEIPVTQKILIAPQIIKSYFGNSRFHYSIYNTNTSYSGYSYEYVTDTDTITGTADLSGWEIPVYYVGDYFLFGLKFSAFSNSAEIEWSNNVVSDISVSGALSIVLDARF